MPSVDRTLGALSHWLRLDVRYYAKSSLHLALGQAAVFLVGLSTSMLFVRLASPEAYGQYNYVLSILGMLSIFGLPGMTTAIIRSVARGYDQVFVQGFRARLRWSLLGSVAALGVGAFYALARGQLALGGVFVLSALVFPFFVTGDTYEAFFQGRRRFGLLSLGQGAVALASGAALVAALYLFPNYPLRIVLAYLLAYSAASNLWLWRTLSGKLNQGIDPGALSYGKHLTVQGLVDQVTQYSDKVIVAVFLDFSELAVYSVALTVMLLESSLLLPLRPVMPSLAQLEEATAYRAVRQRLPLAVLGFAVVCGGAAVAVRYLIPLVFTARYAGAVPYAQLLLLSLFLEGPNLVLAQLFKSQQKVGTLYKLNLATSLLQLPLMLGLVIPFGLVGVVGARVVVQGVRTGIAWLLLVRNTPLAADQRVTS